MSVISWSMCALRNHVAWQKRARGSGFSANMHTVVEKGDVALNSTSGTVKFWPSMRAALEVGAAVVCGGPYTVKGTVVTVLP